MYLITISDEGPGDNHYREIVGYAKTIDEAICVISDGVTKCGYSMNNSTIIYSGIHIVYEFKKELWFVIQPISEASRLDVINIITSWGRYGVKEESTNAES